MKRQKNSRSFLRGSLLIPIFVGLFVVAPHHVSAETLWGKMADRAWQSAHGTVENAALLVHAFPSVTTNAVTAEGEALVASVQTRGSLVRSFFCGFFDLFCEEAVVPVFVENGETEMNAPAVPAELQISRENTTVAIMPTRTMLSGVPSASATYPTYVTNTYPITYVYGNETTGNFITQEFLEIQVDAIYRSMDDGDDSEENGTVDLTLESIESLADVAAMTKTAGDLFSWDGTSWTNISTSSLGISGGGGSSQWTTSGSDIYFESGDVGIGTTTPAATLDVNGTFIARSTTNAVFGDGITGGITIGDGSFTKTAGSDFGLNSGLVLQGELTSQGINMNGYSITDAEDITIGRNQLVARIGVDDAKPIAFYTGADFTSEALRIDSDGNVGIGTTSPNEKLEVNGAIRTSGAATTNLASSGIVDYSLGTMRLISNGPNTSTNGKLQFITQRSHGVNPIVAVSIDDFGNVGIGTTSPISKLDVNAGSNGSVTIRTSNNSVGTGLNLIKSNTSDWSGVNWYVNNEIRWAFGENSEGFGLFENGSAATTRFMVKEGGNVGIGTTSPVAKLSVTGSGTGTGKAFAIADSSNSLKLVIQDNGSVGIGAHSIIPARSLDVTGDILIRESAAANYGTIGFSGIHMAISLAGSEKIRIQNGGNVGIGTVDPSGPLDVENGTNSTLAYFNKTGSGAQAPAIELQSNGVTGLRLSQDTSFGRSFINNGYSVAQALAFGLRGDEKMRITNAGSVGIGTTTPGSLLTVAGEMNVTATSTLATTTVMNTLFIDGDLSQSFGIHFGSSLLQHGAIFATDFFGDDRLYVTGTENAFFGVGLSDGLSVTTDGDDSFVNLQGDELRLYTNFDDITLDSTSNIIMQTTAGNVGIGTTSPVAQLAVDGDVYIDGAFTATGDVSIGNFNMDADPTCGNTYHTFIGPVGTVGGDECAALNVTQEDENGNVIYRFGGVNEAWAGEFYANESLVGMNTKSSLPLSFQVNTNEKMRILSNGNVGIGTSTPYAKLSVAGTIVATSSTSAAGIEYAGFFTQNNGGSGESYGLYGEGVSYGVGSGIGAMLIGRSMGTSSLSTYGAFMSAYNSNTTSGNVFAAYADAPLSGYNRYALYAPPVSGGGGINASIWAGGNTYLAVMSGNVGIGTTTPVAKLDLYDTVLSGSGSLAGSVLNLDQTWNTSGTPTAIKLNVTDIASNASSLLVDLQVDGSTKFNVSKNGFIRGAGTSYLDMNLSSFIIGAGGASRVLVNTGGLLVGSDKFVSWSNASAPSNGSSGDLSLYRDAAGILAQRRGTNSQTFRLYNTYTSATDYERAGFNWVNDALTIGTEHSGTGSARNLAFMTGSTTRMTIDTSGNIGIGTTTPSNKLVIVAGSDQYQTALVIAPSSHATSRRAAMHIDNWEIGQDSQGNGTKDFFIYDRASSTNRFMILKNGYVGIGTTSPAFPLDVDRTISSTQTYGFLNPSGNIGTATGENSYSIRSAGRIMAPEFNAVSDERLKDVQFDLSPEVALDAIMALKPVSFTWKSTPDGQPILGFLAQDVETAIPNAVSQIVGTQYNDQRMLDYNQITAVLVGAFKELAAKVNRVLAWFGEDGESFNVQGDVCVDDVCVSKEAFKALLMEVEDVDEDEDGEATEEETQDEDLDENGAEDEEEIVTDETDDEAVVIGENKEENDTGTQEGDGDQGEDDGGEEEPQVPVENPPVTPPTSQNSSEDPESPDETPVEVPAETPESPVE